MWTAVLALMLLIPSPLLADTVTPSNDFAVSGDFTFGGGKVCPTCAENLAFGFNWDYTAVPQGPELNNVNLYFPSLSNISETWSGSFGTTAGAAPYIATNYIPFFDSAGDEVDIYVENTTDTNVPALQAQNGIQFAFPTAPIIQFGSLYSCAPGSACQIDFMPVFSAFGVGGTLSNVSVTQVQSVHTPEPSSLAMLGISLVIGGIFWTIKKNHDRNLLSRS